MHESFPNDFRYVKLNESTIYLEEIKTVQKNLYYLLMLKEKIIDKSKDFP